INGLRDDSLRTGVKINPKIGAAANLTFNLNETPMPPDDTRHSGQAQTRSLAGLFGGEKRLEDFLDHVGGDACAGVLDLNQHIRSGFGFSISSRARGEAQVLRFERQFSTLRHCVPGIDAQVEQHLVQLARVSDNGPQVWGDLLLERDVFRESLLDNASHFPKQMTQLQDSALSLHTTA